MKQSVHLKTGIKLTVLFHTCLLQLFEKNFFPVERVRGALRRRRHKNVIRQLLTDDLVGKISRIKLHLPNVNFLMQFVAEIIRRYFSTQISLIL